MREVEGGVVVDGVRVFEVGQREPATASSASCCDTEFVADFLDFVANVLQYDHGLSVVFRGMVNSVWADLSRLIVLLALAHHRHVCSMPSPLR